MRERVLVRFKDPGNPTEEERRLLEGYIDERGERIRGAAEREYIRFLDVLEEHMNFYENLIQDADKRVDYQRKKKAVLEGRITELQEYIKTEVDPEDELELTAINKRIKRNKTDIKEIEKRIEGLISDKAIYDVCLTVFKFEILGFKNARGASFLGLETHEIFEILRAQLEEKTAEIKGEPFEDKMPTPAVGIDYIKQKNISAADIIFQEIYNPRRKAFEVLDQRLSAGEKVAKADTALLETRDALLDLIKDLREVTGYELNISEHSESHILFCDSEIPISSLYKIRHDYQIKGVFTTKGTITSHWVIIASGMGMPVVIYEPEESGEAIDIYRVVKPGDETILKTNRQEEGLAIIRPDENDKREAAQLSYEQELEYSFALRKASEPTPLKFYANTASLDDTKLAAEGITDGIGLYRTEIILAPLVAEAKSYIKAVLADSEDISVHRKMLLAYLKQDLLEHIRVLRELARERGLGHIPFIIRLFDIEEDKNEELLKLLPEDQRKTGFDFYRTKVGRAISLVLTEAVISIASEEAGGKEGVSVDLGLMPPMVREPSEIDWLQRNLIAVAYSNVFRESVEVAETYDEGQQLQIPFEEFVSLPHLEGISLGVMAETKEISGKIYEILNRGVRFVSGGTNDWTKDILSKVFGIPVLREDEHFGKLYAELQPFVLSEINKAAQEIARWNMEHPDAPRRILGFCGDLANRKKFVLYALYLKRKYNIEVYLSTTPNTTPLIKDFSRYADRYLGDDELFVIFDRLSYKVDSIASKKAEEIEAKMKDSEKNPDYYREVTLKAEQHWRLIMPGETESAPGANTDLSDEQQSFNAVTSSA